MAEFLEVLESFRSDDEGLKNLFQVNETEGKPVRRKVQTKQYKLQVAEAAKFLTEIITGRRSASQLLEVMTTSDFPYLFGDILDRTVLATYNEWPTTWTALAKRTTVADFRNAKVFPPTWGADGVLGEVGQSEEYPDAAVYEQTPIEWNVLKYGRKVPFSWESIINDDLDMLKDIPVRLGRAARRTENDLVTSLYVGTTGPLSTMYHNDFANIVNTTNGASIDNPALSIVGLNDAYTVLSAMLDESGQPIMREALTLVVPPALEVTARNILNATEIHATSLRGGGSPDNTSGSGYQELSVANWMRNRLTLVVDPYIPLKATSSNGNTSWFLFANPNYSREAIRIGFLRGHETPEIWMKSPNAVRVGGGAVNAMDGDFDTDSITYRIRHIIGAVKIDPKATVASNGSGS